MSIGTDCIGGEKHGLKRMIEYFFKINGLIIYNNNKVRLYGKNSSSKFSMWISVGCISTRYVYYMVK